MVGFEGSCSGGKIHRSGTGRLSGFEGSCSGGKIHRSGRSSRAARSPEVRSPEVRSPEVRSPEVRKSGGSPPMVSPLLLSSSGERRFVCRTASHPVDGSKQRGREDGGGEKKGGGAREIIGGYD